MKINDFVNQFTNASDDVEEVYIEIDGVEYEFTVEERPEVFDGFDTVYPAHIALVKKD